MIKQQLSRLMEKAGIVRGALNRGDRQGALHKAWGYVFSNHLEGDYVEFGVYKGNSFINSYKEYLNFKRWLQNETNSPEEWRRKIAGAYMQNQPIFHGLDTFGGMPPNNEENLTFGEGTFVSDIEEVRNRCIKSGMPENDFFLYKGLFTESTKVLQGNISKYAAIVNIDGDLYESAKDSLHIIEPYLQIGTVLLFDDYNTFHADNSKGERKALIEFSETSSFIFEQWFTYQYVGTAFLCVGKKS